MVRHFLEIYCSFQSRTFVQNIVFVSSIGEVLHSKSEKVPNDSKGYKFLQISHSVGGNLQTISDFGAFKGFDELQKEIDDVWSTFRSAFNSTFFQHNLWNPFTNQSLEDDDH